MQLCSSWAAVAPADCGPTDASRAWSATPLLSRVIAAFAQCFFPSIAVAGTSGGKKRLPSRRETWTKRINTGTSTSGPITAAKATGDAKPKAAMATAMASSKLLRAQEIVLDGASPTGKTLKSTRIFRVFCGEGWPYWTISDPGPRCLMTCIVPPRWPSVLG